MFCCPKQELDTRFVFLKTPLVAAQVYCMARVPIRPAEPYISLRPEPSVVHSLWLPSTKEFDISDATTLYSTVICLTIVSTCTYIF